ncbi:hypothetical protein C6497_02820 [Candidatus Poribacteria bacterium]|nr:MAG: hypothetical protein C6497_02820 [Candidatus Poribacteria bacterium]
MNRIKQMSEKIREGIDQFFEDIENNESEIDKALSDMKNRIPEGIDLVATAIAEEKRLKHEYKELLRIGQISGGNISDDEANADSGWKSEYLRKINELNRQIEEQERVVAELKSDLFDFYQTYQKALKQAKTLSIRQKQAETQAEFYRVLSEFSLPDHKSAFQQAENQVRKTEAQVKMLKQKSRKANSKTKDNESDFNIDDALDELKRDILGSSQND